MNFKGAKIGVIGLGYVGLPLATEFGKVRSVVGFDINKKRVDELNKAIDSTNELTFEELSLDMDLYYTNDIFHLKECSIFIVTVPTPVDADNRPDLTPLKSASEMLGSILKKGDVVIYESTVYPGCTEDDCVPILEKFSGLKFNQDFYCGYSPERINPGDKINKVTTIKKITSGSTPEIATLVDSLYREIVTAGTYSASSIKVAEAAKVIENTQRDVNIALVNELAIIFDRLGIETRDVLSAAETKWNFLPFKPGLVGGHCIGIDPYYLKYKAQAAGYHPEIISAVRRLNDSMGDFVVSKLIKEMIKKKINISDSKVLVMGFTFKENCPDFRNTRVVDVVYGIRDYGSHVDIYDPWVNEEECFKEYKLRPLKSVSAAQYDAVVLAVAHDEFKVMGVDAIKSFVKPNHVLFDLKNIFNINQSDIRL
jgi:UDP-N-acetyl-D-galactosamine dehydrogenase